MIRNLKYGKIAVVVFITILIWVWADLKLDEELPVPNAAISVVNSDPKLWVSFDDASSVTLEEVVLKGPLRKINEISRKLDEGERLKIDFDAVKEKMNEPASYPLNLLPFLQKDKEIKRLGLKVESCKPEMLSVKVVGLVSRLLDVKCVDEDQNPIGEATVKPAQVEMLVPEDWEKSVAEVLLTPREIENARVWTIEETPYIRLAAGQTRQAPKAVEITMPPEPDRLSGYTIKAPTLSIALSPTLQGKYYVEVTNLTGVLLPIAIKATPEAERAYRLQPFPQMTLYILDNDKNTTEEQKREVVYNFPEESVRKGEIKINQQQQQPVIARFKLIPVSSAETSKGPPG
ncbi:MAG TPA: hypothetical protein VMY06_01225 [Sedimentisphaerales bacterium]|nr:hypothetical protein [Sedimentisphaerales bacterium]